jgi:nucleotide-binding universal stress UspA family protein
MKEKMKILVGVDGSDHSTWALMEAISIAKKFSGHIKVITVYKRGNKEEADKTQLKIKHLLNEENIDSSLKAILGSNPSRALVDTAEQEKFDLIVVGNRGLGSAASFLLGSVSKRVVSKASCDVLVVKKVV